MKMARLAFFVLHAFHNLLQCFPPFVTFPSLTFPPNSAPALYCFQVPLAISPRAFHSKLKILLVHKSYLYSPASVYLPFRLNPKHYPPFDCLSACLTFRILTSAYRFCFVCE